MNRSLRFRLPCVLLTGLVAGTSFAAAQAPAAAAAATSTATAASSRDSYVLTPSLRGLVFVATEEQTAAPLSANFAGVDASRAPLLRDLDAAAAFAEFLGAPASLPSLDRVGDRMRAWLRERGENLVVVYLPPQDVTDGVVRLVVARAKLDRELTLNGAKYFSAEQYRDALPLTPGAEIDSAALARGVETLNENPFRRVTLEAKPGVAPGTTRLGLRIEERLPWRFTGGWDNTGTRTSGEQRVSAGVTWGNAFGRGDQLGYRFIADPDIQHSRTHSANYTARLPWRHTATLAGSYSRINSIMAAPFTQEGTSWQVSANYDLRLRAPREGWTQSLSFSADFKYSDNTLEFATFPITDNATHVAQLGATYGVSFPALGGHNSVFVSGYASPGGLTRYNNTDAFTGSRPGAKADYVYGKLSLSHQRPLIRGFSWQTTATAQAASAALLGSEQLNGGGSYAVRGYRESSAFGDWGVVVNNELHAPRFALLKGNDHVDFFAFADLASLNLNVDNESTDLRSAGLGVNYQWRRHVSVRASYGWQLKKLDFSTDSGRAHVGAHVSW